jgi:RhoGEF domain
VNPRQRLIASAGKRAYASAGELVFQRRQDTTSGSSTLTSTTTAATDSGEIGESGGEANAAKMKRGWRKSLVRATIREQRNQPQPRSRTGSFLATFLDTRTMVITEIINTERDYAHDLDVCIRNYMLPMREAGLVNEDQLCSLFSNIEALHECSKRLSTQFSLWHSCGSPRIGQIFTSMVGAE